MQFSEKLSALMNILNVSNKTLATALHVDASLISRWRTGSRIPKNEDYIHLLSHYLAMHAEDYQKLSVIMLMDLPSSVATDRELDLTRLIFEWLSMQPDKGMRGSSDAVERFLRQADRIHINVSLPVQNYYSYSPRGEMQSYESFFGLQGMRDATFKLMSMLLACDEPQIMYMFSDQSLAWLNDDAQYDQVWRDITMRCLKKGHKICVIHSVVRNYYEMFTIIERWLALYMTGQVETYYCPRHLSNVHVQTLNIIPGIAAIISSDFVGCENTAEFRLVTTKEPLNAYFQGLQQHLKQCLPLFTIHTPETADKLQEEHLQHLYAQGDSIAMVDTFSSIYMPEELFVRALARMKTDAKHRQSTLRIFQLKQRIFYQNLQNYTYHEILTIPEPQRLAREGMPLNMSMYFGTQALRYESLSDIKKHIRSLIYLLNNYENFHCYLLHEGNLQNVQIQAKENGGVVFTQQSDLLYVFHIKQPNLTRVFFNYLESELHELPPQARDRQYTIEQLNRYLEL